MEKREIEKEPEVPELSKDDIENITKTCFRDDDILEPADLIFVFGSSHYVKELSEIISNLLIRKLSNKVFLTGGRPDYIDSRKIDKSESLLILDYIDKQMFKGVEFYVENKSTHTTENIMEALKVLDFSKYEKIIFIFKSHASGRGYLTLRKYLPKVKLIQKTFSVSYHNNTDEITKENWYKTDFGKKRVYGEYLRIKKYSERGDIAPISELFK
jgi:uncharacterized SAM-binding protein YcdF (DUF218 family)